MSEPGVLVIGGDYRGLTIARSLGRCQIPVWVAHTADDRIATYSRYTTRTVPWDHDRSEAEGLADLVRLATEHSLEGWVLIPTSDKQAELVSHHHTELARYYTLVTSPSERYELAQDKRRTYERAEVLGIAIPRTWKVSTMAEVEALDLEYPVLLKVESGVIDNPITDKKVWQIDDREQLLARYAEALTFPLPDGLVMIQEIIPGGGACQLSFAATCLDGRVLAWLTARRTRQIPMDYGRSSTFVETIEPPADLVEQSTRTIADFGLTGLVEVEFKRDPRDGQLKLLDVNARAWGWMAIGTAAGVDFPYLTWRAALGRHVEPVPARVGVRWVRLTTDVPTSVKEILAGRMTLGAYLRTMRPPLEGSIAAKDDMRPALMEVPILAMRMTKRAVDRTRNKTTQPA